MQILIDMVVYWKLNITCVCICKEEQRGQSAEEVTKGPVIVPDVVNNSARQCQCEQGVRECEVDQINGGGVEFLLPLAGHIENQTVAAHADDKNH